MRVGNAVGENSPKQAKSYTRVIVCLGMIFGVITYIVFYTQNNTIFGLMTSNQEIIGCMNSALPAFCVLLLSDSVQGTLKGPLSAIGRQKLVGSITGV